MGYRKNVYEKNKRRKESESHHEKGNYVFCGGAGKSKLLFESEAKAMTFIKFNADEIRETRGQAPCRAYYCECCGGWHITHTKAYHEDMDMRKNIVVEAYREEREMKRVANEMQQAIAHERALERRRRKAMEAKMKKDENNK